MIDGVECLEGGGGLNWDLSDYKIPKGTSVDYDGIEIV